MSRCRLWTTLEERKLRELLATGLKHAAIAKRLGRDKGSVDGKIIRLKRHEGVQPLPRVHKKGELVAKLRILCIPGVPDSAVADILGVVKDTVEATRRRNGIPSGWKKGGRLSPPEKSNISTAAKILRLYAGIGRSDAEIGRIIGIAKASVRYHREKFGLPPIGSNNKEVTHELD